jgi:hypothetical protein
LGGIWVMSFPFIFNTIKNFWGVKNTLKCFIGEVNIFFSDENLPLKIQTSSCVTGDITYTVESKGNSWFEKYDFYFEDIKVYTKQEVLVWEQLWDVYEEDEYKFFKLLNSYKNTNGIVIGAHDGTYGEWITMLDNPKNQILLVEPSTMQFDKLNKTLGKRNNVNLLKSLITCDGGEVEFYEEESGFFNSTNKTHLEKFFNLDTIKISKKNSISMTELLENNFIGNLDWIHLDTESYDAQLILSVKDKSYLLPKMIVFEHTHLKIDEKYELEKFLKQQNYNINIFTDNTIAFK